MFLELSNVQKIVILKVKACLLSLDCNVLSCVKTLLEANWIMLYWSSDPISSSSPPPTPFEAYQWVVKGQGAKKGQQKSPGTSRNQVVLIGKHHKVVCRVLVYFLRLVKILWDGSIKVGEFFLYFFISLFIIPRAFHWLWNYR